MGMTKTVLDSKAGMAVAAIAAIAFVGYFAAKKTAAVAKETAADVGNAINPVNPDNVFNTGVNAVGESLSGQKGWTLGGWLYDVTHPQDANSAGIVAPKYGGINPPITRDGAWNSYDREQLKMQGSSGIDPTPY